MIRFIFACMAFVALSILGTAGLFMAESINDAKQGVVARNNAVMTPEQTAATTGDMGVSFEEIYANAPVPEQDLSPEGLNDIATAAGGNDSFTGGFTNTAPKALADKEIGAEAPVMDNTAATQPYSN